MCRALVEWSRGQRVEHAHHVVDRIVGQMGIGGVPLDAADDEIPGGAAPSPNLDHVAEGVRVGGLTNEAGIKVFPAFGKPFENLAGAINRRAFFVAGDQQAYRSGFGPTVRVSVSFGQLVDSSHKGGDGALHVCRAAPVQHAVDHRARERVA